MSFYTISGAPTHGIGMVMPGLIKEPSVSLWALGFIKMIKLIQVVFFIIFLGGNFAYALCDVSKLPNSTDCLGDSDTMCCIVESYSHNQTCYEVWCYEYNQCDWYQQTDALCT